MNSSLYTPGGYAPNVYASDEASQDFSFDYTTQNQEFFGQGGASNMFPTHIDNNNALLTGDMVFASTSARRSVSPPTPSQLLQQHGLHGLGISIPDSHGPYLHVNPPYHSIDPNALHSPYVSPAHSRNGSLQSQTGYVPGYAPSPYASVDPMAIYNRDQFGVYSYQNQYSPHPPAPIQPISEPFTPPMTIAPTLVYSPANSRRPSFQPTTVSTEPSPVIMRVNLTSCSPAASPYIGHARTPSACSRHSDREESGTSSYSPYSHGRTISSSTGAFSPVTLPVTPHIRNGSLSTNSHRGSSPAWSVGTSNGGMGGGFGKFPLDSRAELLKSAKKRKRRDIGMESSEDEYTGAVEEAEPSDDDYDDEFGTKKRSKKGKRMSKKQRVVQGVTSMTLNDGNSTSGLSTLSGQSPLSDSAVLQGEDIKVWKLIPISRDDTSCPHCGFKPSNRRYSDLKRHWEKHLIKEAKEKPRWVCLDCGDVEEVVVQEQEEDGTMTLRSIKEYVLRAPSLKVYTRKDSGGRHWKLDHKEKQGMLWRDNRIVLVDRIRGEGQDGHSSSEA